MVLNLPIRHHKIKVSLDVEGNTPLVITGYDALIPNIVYFNRRFPLNGKSSVEIPMPLTPDKLCLSVEKQGGGLPKISSFKFKPLRYAVYGGAKREFIEFAEYIAINLDNMPNGEYRSEGEKYVAVIRDNIPENATTPSRIHKALRFIDISKEHFRKLTVYRRMVILLHEFSHGFINNDIDDEFEADKNGNAIFLKSGFPALEIMYAYEDVFSDTELNRERTNKAMNQAMIYA